MIDKKIEEIYNIIKNGDKNLHTYEMCKIALKNYYNASKYINPKFLSYNDNDNDEENKKNYELCIIGAQHTGYILKFMDPRLMTEELICYALEPKEYLYYPQFLENKEGSFIKYVPKEKINEKYV